MKKLLIAAISVFILTNIALAQSTTQQKIDSLQKGKTQVDQELKSLLEIKKAEEEAKIEKAEKVYKERYPEFELAGIGLDGFKSVIVYGLVRNPNWKLIDIQYKKFDYDIRIKSIPNYRESLHFWEWWYAERAKLACEWHNDTKEYNQWKALFAVQRYIKTYMNGFLDSYYGEDPYEIDKNYDYVLKNKIVNSKCKTIKIYYQDLPENSFIKFHHYHDGTYFTKLENPLLSVKCFLEGKEKPIEILDPRSEAFMLSKGISADIAKSDPFIDDSNIYVYKGTLLEKVTGRVKCDKDKLYREGEESKFEKVPVDSLPQKHLKTFKIEDYK